MYIDEKILEKVLAQYGFTLGDILKAAKKQKQPVAEQDWIYLIHHFHPPKKEADMETLHHCHFFEKKGMKGKAYYQKHKKDGKVFQHVIDLKASKVKNVEDVPAILYDHLNNGFKVKIMEIDKTKYAVLNGLASVKKTKWSDQDVGGYYDSIS